MRYVLLPLVLAAGCVDSGPSAAELMARIEVAEARVEQRDADLAKAVESKDIIFSIRYEQHIEELTGVSDYAYSDLEIEADSAAGMPLAVWNGGYNLDFTDKSEEAQRRIAAYQEARKNREAARAAIMDSTTPQGAAFNDDMEPTRGSVRRHEKELSDAKEALEELRQQVEQLGS